MNSTDKDKYPHSQSRQFDIDHAEFVKGDLQTKLKLYAWFDRVQEAWERKYINNVGELVQMLATHLTGDFKHLCERELRDGWFSIDLQPSDWTDYKADDYTGHWTVEACVAEYSCKFYVKDADRDLYCQIDDSRYD